MGGEGVSQVVEAYIGKPCFLEQLFHLSICRRRCYGKFGAKRIGENPLFLCSDKAGFITGENICIDGGMTRQMIYHGDWGWTLHAKM